MLNKPPVNSLYSTEEDLAILPLMTALFVDGLGPSKDILDLGSEWLGKTVGKNRQARIFRLPVDAYEPQSIETRKTSEKYRCSQREDQCANSLKKPFGQGVGVRPLIRGMSHHFNNLLMGIWGNATLIRLQLDDSDPLYPHVMQMERLIQSGACLIHLVLGYLGERRTVARRLRLNQLIAQIRSELPENSQVDTELDVEALLKWALRVQRPRIIASSTARVLELLFMSIQSHCNAMPDYKDRDAEMHKKIDTIRRLVLRGMEITHRLRLYAGDSKARKTKVNLPALIKRATTQLRDRTPSIAVNCRISSNLPVIRAERSNLEWVFKQLLSNALAAMPQKGTLDIRVCTLQEEAPQDRCGVLKGSDYVVISFKDTGSGLSAKIQKHIFEPFFAYPQNPRRLGLGLSASVGVLMAHNGYIQVRSKEKSGSTFSVYLPIAGTALQGQRLKATP